MNISGVFHIYQRYFTNKHISMLRNNFQYYRIWRSNAKYSSSHYTHKFFAFIHIHCIPWNKYFRCFSFFSSFFCIRNPVPVLLNVIVFPNKIKYLMFCVYVLLHTIFHSLAITIIIIMIIILYSVI